jgi:hypothetical protein
MAGQWLAWRRDCLITVLEVAQIGITGRLDAEPTDKKAQQYLSPTEGIKIAASNLLSNLINFYGAFPSTTGPTSLSALQLEVWFARLVDDWTAHSQLTLRLRLRLRLRLHRVGGCVAAIWTQGLGENIVHVQ